MRLFFYAYLPDISKPYRTKFTHTYTTYSRDIGEDVLQVYAYVPDALWISGYGISFLFHLKFFCRFAHRFPTHSRSDRRFLAHTIPTLSLSDLCI